jgi:hypothetical protein
LTERLEAAYAHVRKELSKLEEQYMDSMLTYFDEKEKYGVAHKSDKYESILNEIKLEKLRLYVKTIRENFIEFDIEFFQKRSCN